MKDILNIDKYRTDYENTIIQMDDYLGSLMLSELMSLDPTSIKETAMLNNLEKINKLQEGRNNLDLLMKYLDTQK